MYLFSIFMNTELFANVAYLMAELSVQCLHRLRLLIALQGSGAAGWFFCLQERQQEEVKSISDPACSESCNHVSPCSNSALAQPACRWGKNRQRASSQTSCVLNPVALALCFHKSSLTGLLACLQIMGQEEVKSFISEHIQAEMGVRFRQGRCRCQPKGHKWKDLLDSISELVTHHLQEVCDHSLAYDALVVHIYKKHRYMFVVVCMHAMILLLVAKRSAWHLFQSWNMSSPAILAAS